MRVGRGTEEGVHIGPLIDDAAVTKVAEHVDDARAKGARIVDGGARVERPGLSRRFFQPTIIEGFTDAMLVSHEETFGPVAPIRRFTHEAEALEMANRSIYGLAAYFYTRDASRLMRVAEALEYGVIGANDALPSTAQAPFGGMKQSGIGREGGRHVMDEYLEVKYVSWGQIDIVTTSRTEELIARRRSVVPRGVGMFAGEIAMASGRAATLVDADGREWLDLAGGIGVMAVGHCHPDVVRPFRNRPRGSSTRAFTWPPTSRTSRSARSWSSLLPHGERTKAMLVNTGAEAVENASRSRVRRRGRPAISATRAPSTAGRFSA